MCNGNNPSFDLIIHPISLNGLITLFIGLLDSDASPINENERYCEDNNPVNNLEVVPEFPQSIGSIGFSKVDPVTRL